MLNPTEVERKAQRCCLKPFGTVAEEIGFNKPLGAYSEAEALQVIDAIVSGYTQAMVEHHEATRYPPVRGLTDPVNDPFANLFADLEGDPPFEVKP